MDLLLLFLKVTAVPEMVLLPPEVTLFKFSLPSETESV
jgi:hypothetical protein